MQQTLAKVKHLEKFIRKYGEDTVIFQTINKMLEYKIGTYDEEINRLNKELRKLERKYKKESSVFFNEFKQGSLGDDMDFLDWASLYRMKNKLAEKKAGLEGIR